MDFIPFFSNENTYLSLYCAIVIVIVLYLATIPNSGLLPTPQIQGVLHGSLNVPIEHHPTIRYMVYNGYYKVMSNIPEMGQLPTPVLNG